MVNFHFSKKQELSDLEWIFGEYDFYIKNKYRVVYPDFSQNLMRELIRNPKYEGRELGSEFNIIFEKDKDDYSNAVTTVSANWKVIEAKFFTHLVKL